MPMTLLLLAMAPRDVDGDVSPVLSNILVVCERNSTVTVSSGDADRARGHRKDYKNEVIKYTRHGLWGFIFYSTQMN